jgi:hypothetical protein
LLATALTKLLNHRLTIIDLLGGKMENPVRATIAMMFERNTMIYFAMASLVLFAADLSGFKGTIPTWTELFIWPLALALYIVFYCGALILGAALQRKLRKVPIPTVILSALTVFPAVFLMEHLVAWASQGSYDMALLPHFAAYYIVAQAFETIFLKYVYPLSAIIKAQTPPAPSSQRTVLVAGESLSVSDIAYIVAREHQVEICLSGEIITRRARLRDIVAQTEEVDGMQPHRSWWVSSAANAVLERIENRPHLRLADDTLVPIARGRLEDVLCWLDRQDG